MKLPLRFAFLGLALDLTVEKGGERRTFGWSEPHWVCTDETARKLWIFPAPEGRGWKLKNGEDEAVARIVRRFSQFEPTRLTPVELETGPSEARGKCVAIGYRSHKWSGRPRNYEHAFRRPASVVQAGVVYRLAGPSLRVTAAGIEG